MLTTKELAGLIGQQGSILHGDLRVFVMVEDVKVQWGKTRYLVTPVSGEGSMWVENFFQKGGN